MSTVIARDRSLANYKIKRWKKNVTNTELTMLSNRISDYSYINQGKTRIPGINDGLEMDATDVSPAPRVSLSLGEIQASLISCEIININLCYRSSFTEGKIFKSLRKIIRTICQMIKVELF